MQNDYEFYGRTLTPSIAKKLIKDNLAGQYLSLKDIRRKVDKLHLDSGGQKTLMKSGHPVSDALGQLKKEELASNPLPMRWKGFSTR